MLSPPARPIHFGTLREQLGISARRLRSWMKAGLPYSVSVTKAPLFYGHAVAEWLIETGRAVRTDAVDQANGAARIARTIAEVAVHFGVAVRTVGFWCKEAGFPGRPGSPGRQDGHFPLEEIAAWLRTRGTEHNAELAALRLRRLTIRTEREALQLAALEGTLARPEEIEATARHLADQAAPVLDSLVDAMVKDAPKLPAADRKALRSLLRRRIEEANHILAECVAGDTDAPDAT